MNKPTSMPGALFAIISILILATACHSGSGSNAQDNHNAAQANRNETADNRNGASESGAADKPGSKQGEASEEDFEGTAGTTEKRKQGRSPGVLKEVRTAAHPNFDRVVFEFDGESVPGYKLEYVDKPVRKCGSGDAATVAGDAWLNVTFTPAQAHTDAGQATVEDRERHPNLKTLKELESICDFEGEVAWVFGLSAPNRYRVIELASPARLVVDIKH